MTYIQELQSVIQHLHHATARHIKSVPVKETYQGRVVWDGVVEVFDLTDHPHADRIYAWSHDTDDPKHHTKHITVLHIPPVISPETAVRAAIVQEFKSRGKA